MVTLNPSDAHAPFTDAETGKIRFGDLNFNNILFNQVNQILYLLTNISMSTSPGDYQRNTNLLEDSIENTELFLSPHLKRDKIYQKGRKVIKARKYPNFIVKYKDQLTSLNRYDTQENKMYNAIKISHDCDCRIDQCKSLFKILMDWMDRKGIHFSEAEDSVIESGGKPDA